MTEIVIYEVQNLNSAEWYKIRHTPKTKITEKEEVIITTVPKNSLVLKLKSFLFPRIKEGDKIKATLSIKCIKACTDAKIGSAVGASMSRFQMY